MYQDPYSPQQPYQPQPGAASPYPPQQQPDASTNPYQSGAAPYPYQSQPGAAPYPYQPQPGGIHYPQPGAAPYPYQPQPGGIHYPQPGVAPYSPGKLKVSLVNPRAQRAMINGIISIAFSLLTLVTLAGYAGVITGTFAIVYGFIGLNRAKSLPNNAGRGRAIAGIVLGFTAWFLVIVSFMLRQMAQG